MKKIIRKQMRLVEKSKFKFDSSFEKNIYAYLCFRKVKRNSLDDELKFNYYYEWKNYIIDKYKNSDTIALREFSRYLNLRRNIIKSDYNYWYICIPVVLTLIVNSFFNLCFESDCINGLFKINLNGMDIQIAMALIVIIVMITFFVLVIAVILPLIVAIISLFEPLWNSMNEKNFYEDYKEVIDDIINKREDKY